MTTHRTNGGPAFPAAVSEWIDHPVHGRINRAEIGEAPETGMSLRDWFAGQAMQGLLANKGDPRDYLTQVARDAYEIADAMLAERSK